MVSQILQYPGSLQLPLDATGEKSAAPAMEVMCIRAGWKSDQEARGLSYLETLYKVSALSNFFSLRKLGKNGSANGNKSGFQLNMAKLFAFSLQKCNYFQLYFEGNLLEKISAQLC